MRFSPIFLAAMTAAAALGLAHPKAEASEAVNALTETANPSEPTRSSDSATPEQPALITTQPPDQGSVQGSAPSAVAPSTVIPLSSNIALPTVTSPEFSNSVIAQQTLPTDPSSESQNQPGNPPPGTQTPGSVTSPDQLQFDPIPGPDFNFDIPSTQPTTPATPSPSEANPSQTPAAPALPGTNPPATQTPSPQTPDQADQTEPRVLVSEVLVSGTEGDLLNQVYGAIQTRPGTITTRSQLQQDINAVFATGYFSNVRAVPEDTPLGVRVTFYVQPNPVLQQVQVQGSVLQNITYQGREVPLQEAVNDIFADQYGDTVNLRQLQAGIKQLDQLYRDNGYVLAQVVSAPQIAPDGTVTLEVAEGVIENIQVRFLKDGQPIDEEGNPVRGRTRDFIITREFESQPGDVFNQNQIRRDLQRAFGLGIFEDLNISLNPGQDPRQVDVVVNVTERNTGSLAAGFGVSSASGIFGSVSFQEQNLGGNDQNLTAEVQLGQRDLLFDINFTDPWIGGDPNRTSYSVNAFGRQSISLIFDGGPREVNLPNGDRPRVRRYGAGVSFSRPFGDDWRATLGTQFQNVTVRDLDGEITPRDEFGNLLSYNESGTDNIWTVQLSAVRDRRNDPIQTTSGSVLRLSTEQAIPIDGIGFNRLRGSYSYFLPVRFTRLTPGCQKDNPSPEDCPQTLAFNVQAGTIIGDFPPYEAFALGGTDSVRGYGAGDLGSGSSFVQATIEYRFPVFSIVSGALFADVGSDLGTASNIQGDPAGIREKPGSGFDYGAGLRVQTPIGLVRVDYALNDQGENRITFGIGQGF